MRTKFIAANYIQDESLWAIVSQAGPITIDKNGYWGLSTKKPERRLAVFKTKEEAKAVSIRIRKSNTDFFRLGWIDVVQIGIFREPKASNDEQ
jgi:hypothetical protein